MQIYSKFVLWVLKSRPLRVVYEVACFPTPSMVEMFVFVLIHIQTHWLQSMSSVLQHSTPHQTVHYTMCRVGIHLLLIFRVCVRELMCLWVCKQINEKELNVCRFEQACFGLCTHISVFVVVSFRFLCHSHSFRHFLLCDILVVRGRCVCV